MNEQQETPIDKARVIGIFAHVDAGKTTTSEAILYHTGRIHQVGSVDEGSTQLDWMPQERQRGITVTSAATACDWQGHRINLIDTPGHIDFSAEVVRSIRVIDGAVIVLCGVGGVEPQSEAVWIHADRENLARIIFVNKLDRVGADFDRVLARIQEQLAPHAVALQIPVGRERAFSGIVDLITQQALTWQNGEDEPSVRPVPSAMERKVAAARTSLVDTICETDDALLEQRLEGRHPDEATLRDALRHATIQGKLAPVICGSALNGIGIQPLLDAIVAYLPAPTDMPGVRPAVPARAEGTVVRLGDSDAPFCAVAFKIVTDPHVGHMTWVRVFSGHLKVGKTIYNSRADVQERVGRIYRMHGNKRERVDQMSAGDVVALVGVKSAVTGDTLCDPACPIELETFPFPAPVISVALMPTSDTERASLQRALARLCNEDPTLIVRFDPETGEQTLSGMGELHLEIAVDRLRTEFGIISQVSEPQIACRETIRRAAESIGTHKKQTGGHGHYAQVRLRIEPLERGKGVVFENAVAPWQGPSGNEHGRRALVPAGMRRPIESGVRETLEKGVLAGYPVTDVRVSLLGGKFHEVDSSGQDFRIAASMAVRQAVRRAQPALLEPMMRIDVNVREEHLGAVLTDIGRRRGSVKGIDAQGAVKQVSDLHAGVSPLRTRTGGHRPSNH
ncbi:MAG: elongation factor G [Planctomycetota bacterium]|jgi:elongation factor G